MSFEEVHVGYCKRMGWSAGERSRTGPFEGPGRLTDHLPMNNITIAELEDCLLHINVWKACEPDEVPRILLRSVSVVIFYFVSRDYKDLEKRTANNHIKGRLAVGIVGVPRKTHCTGCWKTRQPGKYRSTIFFTTKGVFDNVWLARSSNIAKEEKSN